MLLIIILLLLLNKCIRFPFPRTSDEKTVNHLYISRMNEVANNEYILNKREKKK